MNSDDAVRVDDGSGTSSRIEMGHEPPPPPLFTGKTVTSAGCRVHLTDPATGDEQILYGGDWHENERRLRESRKY